MRLLVFRRKDDGAPHGNPEPVAGTTRSEVKLTKTGRHGQIKSSAESRVSSAT
ncbi:MAG: hypothetical protein LBB14_02440 [Puniceicoccales bacterium]|nr:hypothetical protein [Puniceicoccales bacterium]